MRWHEMIHEWRRTINARESRSDEREGDKNEESNGLSIKEK